MRLKPFTVAWLAMLPWLCLGQSKIALTFNSEAFRLVFTSTGWPQSLPSDAIPTQSKEFDFPLGALAPDDYLVVWDRDFNNAGLRLVKDVKGAWNVRPQDYRYLGIVKVRVEHAGAAVAAAQVAISDGARSESQLIDSSSSGEASFFGLLPGELKVTVSYRSHGQEAPPMVEGFPIALQRSRPEPLLVVSIPDDVETLPAVAPASAAPKPSPKAEKSSPVSAIGAVMVYLGALLLAGLAIYGLLMYIKNNRETVDSKLKSLGVEMPDPAPGPPAPGAPPAKPEPPQKIILEDSEPTPLAPGAAPPAPSGPPLSVARPGDAMPRLARDGGESISLANGENFVGRDPGLIVSLPNESTVSRRHASLVVDGATVTVKDLGSTNGTLVNGAKLDSARPLSPGDTVQFGQVLFRFEI